jgi:proteic killer suppression protein
LIRSFRCRDTAALFADQFVPRFRSIERAGQHNIRINERGRICFRWRDGEAHEVEIVDDH